MTIADQLNSADSQACVYGYDDLARLTTDRCFGQSHPNPVVRDQSFSYDAFGNLAKTSIGPGVVFQPTYGTPSATNRYVTLPGGTPSYDSNGNLLYDGFHHYSWTAENKSATIDGGTITGVTYDAFGRWVERSLSNGTYDQGVYAPGGSAELFISNAGTMKTAYLPLLAGAYVGYNSVGLAWSGHPDWQGTSRLITNPNRQMTLDLAYTPYGDQYVASGATDTFFTYTGQSAESGDTKTFPARLFHPAQGRWLTPDPAGLSMGIDSCGAIRLR